MANNLSEFADEKRRAKKEVFLRGLTMGDSIQSSAQRAEISRKTVYEWRKTDEEFAVAWDEALEAGVERLEDAAYNRALEGSDTLMIFLLKAKRPKVYSDRQRLEHTGVDGGPISIKTIERRIVDPSD